MAILLGLLIAAAAGMAFMKRGLFSAATALVAVLFAAVAGVAFGAPVAHLTEWQSAYTHAACVAGIGLLAFVVIRGVLIFIDVEVEFHPLVDRIGGAVAGAASAGVAFGFVALCAVLMPLPKQVAWFERSLRQSTEMILVPGHFVTRLAPGRKAWGLRAIEEAGVPYGVYVPPPPPPQADPESGAPQANPKSDRAETRDGSG